MLLRRLLFAKKHITPPKLGRWTMEKKDVDLKVIFANHDNCCCGDSTVNLLPSPAPLKKIASSRVEAEVPADGNVGGNLP